MTLRRRGYLTEGFNKVQKQVLHLLARMEKKGLTVLSSGNGEGTASMVRLFPNVKRPSDRDSVQIPTSKFKELTSAGEIAVEPRGSHFVVRLKGSK